MAAVGSILGLIVLLSMVALVALCRVYPQVRLIILFVILAGTMLLMLPLLSNEVHLLSIAATAIPFVLMCNLTAGYVLNKGRIVAAKWLLIASLSSLIVGVLVGIKDTYWDDFSGNFSVDDMVFFGLPLLGIVAPLALTIKALGLLRSGRTDGVQKTLLWSNWITSILGVPSILLGLYVMAMAGGSNH